MRTKGVWPGLVTLRSGWAKGVARPWGDNDSEASLRLERGSADFIGECVDALSEFGVSMVYSPPLDPSSRTVWEEARFAHHLSLDLYSRSLLEPTPPPTGRIDVGTGADWERAAEIDDAAFAAPWRMGRIGLEEAKDATPRAELLVARSDGVVTGFAIVGCAMATAYLQRLAVDPEHARSGTGRDLVRAASAWSITQGAARMVLNTQPDNAAAAALYRSEGFEVAPGALAVLATSC